MSIGLTILATSAGMLMVLLMLFKAEENRSERIILKRVRSLLDAAVVWCSQKFTHLFGHVGAGVFRVTFHYALHKVLAFVILFVTKVEKHLMRLQLRNKRIAKVTKPRESGTETHLDAIATHKVETSLTEAEKRKRRLH